MPISAVLRRHYLFYDVTKTATVHFVDCQGQAIKIIIKNNFAINRI